MVVVSCAAGGPAPTSASMLKTTLFSITVVAVACTNEHNPKQPDLPSVADFFGQSQARLEFEPGSFDPGTHTASVAVSVREGTLVIHVGVDPEVEAVTLHPAQLATFYGLDTKGHAET